eukprot:CAMPEP_0194314072 /NCGR_PEP_ID=MMETSP0171-20130528/10885_1 /TAXON_ID=218684 /ORGANISM="Corethron pennatum, Strain L29A3" /LENGTH=541 /DNA_ID=CAMNT_0039069299 /DNA_START=132 /DNA_END=1757 /DNA_ORIENTATION=-
MKLPREILSLRPQIDNVRKALLPLESAAMLLLALSSGACIVTAQDQKIGLSPQKTEKLTLAMTSFIRGSEGSVAVTFPSLKDEDSTVKIYNMFEYIAKVDRQTREEHEAKAIEWGGHLASIASKGEMIFMKSLLPENDPFLIGGERRGSVVDGDVGPGPLYWMWLDDSLWTYTNWQRNRPSNNQDNSSVIVTKSGNWSDVNSDERFPAIYKKKINEQLCDNANPCYDGAFCNFSNETNGSCNVCEENCYDNELNLSTPGATDCQDHCDQIYTVCSDNEKYEYYINSIHRTWEEQEQIASKTFGGHLASIHSDEDRALVEGLIDLMAGNFSYAIGGQRRMVRETNDPPGPGALSWMWSDGTSWDYYEPWETNGPSSNTEKSIVVIEEGGNWTDVKNDRIYPAVFKRLITESSESPTIACPSVTPPPSVIPTTMPVTAIPVGPPTGPSPGTHSESAAQSNVGWVIFWVFFTLSLILCVGCIYPRYEVVLAKISTVIHSMSCLHWCPRYPSGLGATSGVSDEDSDDESFGGEGTRLVSDRLIVG